MRRRRIGALLGAFVLMFGVASSALASSAKVGTLHNGGGNCDNKSGPTADLSIQTSGKNGNDNGQGGDQKDKCDPKIAIHKTADPTTLPPVGGSVTYTYVVTNAGDVPLVNVVVTDDKCAPVTGPAAGGDANSNGKLDLKESWVYTCTTTITATTTNVGTANADWTDCSKAKGGGSDGKGGSDGNGGSGGSDHSGGYSIQTNGQTHVGDGGDDDANGGDNDDDDCVTKAVPPASNSATVTVAQAAPAIAIDKTADPATLPAGGGSVTYTYVVTNAGNVPLADVVVTDDKCAPVTGPAAGGDANSNGKLDLTESWTFSCTTTLTATTTNVGTANATWDDSPVTPATDSATVTVAQSATQPGISIDKTADPTTRLQRWLGTYTYVVTNTGNVALTHVSVSDDDGTPANTSDDFLPGCPATTLAVGASMTCTATVTGLTATVTNIATVTANVGDSSDTVSDTASATVTVTARRRWWRDERPARDRATDGLGDPDQQRPEQHASAPAHRPRRHRPRRGGADPASRQEALTHLAAGSGWRRTL